MNQRNRITALDNLRAIAILLVIGRHAGLPEVGLFNDVTVIPIRVWFSLGWTGVDLFFVLSGFLVSGLLFREYQKNGSINVWRFLVRRGFKIYPPFYFFLIASALANYYLLKIFGANHSFLARPSWEIMFSEAFYLQNYWKALWGHTWSLAVEEHFYFLIAVLFLFLVRIGGGTRNPFQAIPKICIVVGIVLVSLRIIFVHSELFSVGRIGSSTHLRIDSLLIGVVISYFSHFHNSKLRNFVKAHQQKIRIISVALIAPCLVPQWTFSDFLISFQLTLLYLGYAGILLLTLFRDSPNQRSPGVLALIGRHSYSIYLWHLPFSEWTNYLGKYFWPELWGYLPHLFVYGILSVSVGVLLSVTIEQRFLLIRDRLFPSASGPIFVGS